MRAASRSTSWADTHPRAKRSGGRSDGGVAAHSYTRNGRDLPWRRTTDPYSILVSEIMLQQTQVDRVIPRYLDGSSAGRPRRHSPRRRAADDLRAWQGLGYNRRALALHRAAKAIASDGWPDDLTRASRTSAPYTAAAIRNFALATTCCPTTSTSTASSGGQGSASPAHAAQALMDLGATICLARIPRCDVCPLTTGCPARGTRDEPLRRQWGSRARSASAARRPLRLVAATPAPAPRDELEREAMESLERDGLVVSLADGSVTLP